MKAPTLKLPDIKIPDLPKPVKLSLAVIGGSLVLFIILFLTLGSGLETAEVDARRLQAELQTLQKNVTQSKTDIEFIKNNKDRFDALLSSDKLIPHTRRTAIRQMQALALEFGLSNLQYNFQAAAAAAPESVTSQPKSDSYRVSVESIDLSVGSPIDASIYSFIAAVHDDFPGSMVLTEMEMERAPTISPEALNNVSRGADSGLVKGKLKYLWRTAQQNKQEKK